MASCRPSRAARQHCFVCLRHRGNMRAMNCVTRSLVVLISGVILVLAGCSKPPQITAQEQAKYDAVFAEASMTPRAREKWARSCALCHVAGQGGAPRMGHPQEWKPRLEKGRAVLLKHTLEGFNRMPPLGYCMACDTRDFAAMIDMMSGKDQ